MTGRHGTRCAPDAFGRCVSALDQEPRQSARSEASRPLQPKPSAPRIHPCRRLPPHSKPEETGLEYLPDAAPRWACRPQRQTALRAEANVSKSRQSPRPCAPSKPIRRLGPSRAQPESACSPPSARRPSENFSGAHSVSTSGPGPRKSRFFTLRRRTARRKPASLQLASGKRFIPPDLCGPPGLVPVPLRAQSCQYNRSL